MTIYIENLIFDAIIGILKEERETPQKIVINCKIKYKLKKNSFLDYTKIVNLIETTIKKEKFLLLEDAVSFLLEKIKSNFEEISSIKLKISKPNILPNSEVSIQKSKKY